MMPIDFSQPFYDSMKTYDENFQLGPFGVFKNQENYIQPGEPGDDFVGNKVNLPFGIAAGPLLNARFIEAAFRSGYDLCVYKTVRTKECPCHPWPNVVPVTINDAMGNTQDPRRAFALDWKDPSISITNLSITNSFGVPSQPPEFWQDDMQRAVKAEGRGQVVIGSFQGTKRENQTPQAYIDDFVSAARLVKETGAKVMEANYSCPNEGTNQLLCFDVDRVTWITTAIKNEIGNTPLLLKLAYFDDDRLLQRLIKSVGGMVEGLVAINTIPALIQDRQGHPVLPGKSRESSGICGNFIYPYGLDMVRRLFHHREEMGLSFQIIGVGGVSTREHYLKYREMGADSVMCATGAMYDPWLARRLKSGA